MKQTVQLEDYKHANCSALSVAKTISIPINWERVLSFSHENKNRDVNVKKEENEERMVILRTKKVKN